MNNAPSDTVLRALITRISAHIRAILNRNVLVPRTYVQQFSGQSTRQLVLPEYPLLVLTSLVIDGVTVSIAPQPGPDITSSFGYRFQPWNGVPPGMPGVLDLTGLSFIRGLQNVVATYTAGYQVTAEAQTVPAGPSPSITPFAPYGSWATDQGVVNATTGVAFTATSSGTPTVGQYQPPAPDIDTPRSTYLFNTADANTPVLLSYGFIPADLEQVAIEIIAERAAYRSRVGMHSQSLAGQETMAFYDTSGIPAYAAEMLRPYESVLPPAIGAPV